MYSIFEDKQQNCSANQCTCVYNDKREININEDSREVEASSNVMAHAQKPDFVLRLK
jgi:hypothetical protein